MSYIKKEGFQPNLVTFWDIEDPENYISYRLTHSFLAPILLDEDLLLINLKDTPLNDDVILAIDDKANPLVRFFVQEGHQIYLKSTELPIIKLEGSIKIIGKIEAIRRKLIPKKL